MITVIPVHLDLPLGVNGLKRLGFKYALVQNNYIKT